MKKVRPVANMAILALILVPFAASCGDSDTTGLESPSTSVASLPIETVDDAMVPRGKVRTPSGRLVDRSCVVEIPDRAVVKDDGAILVDGKLVGRTPNCTPEQMGGAMPRGNASAKIQPPGFNGWIESSKAQASPGTFWKSIQAQWRVPPAPTSNLNKIIYLFPSLQNLQSANQEIIQPVLQYGGNGAFGGNYWVISSWYVYSNGERHSTPKVVNVGERLWGQIIYEYPGTQGTVHYSITTASLDRPSQSTKLTAMRTNGPFNEVNGGVLEAYSISVCSQLPDPAPASGPMQFTNIAVYDVNFVQVSPTWSNVVNIGGASPQCGYFVGSGQSGGLDFTNLFFN